jgi:hypothetical protein
MTVRVAAPLRRLLALAILLVPLLALWAFAVAPLLDRYTESQDAIERSLQLLARYRANAGQKDEMAERLRQRRQTANQQRGFIEAQNLPLASSALQTGLRRLLETNGAAVRVLSVAPPVKEQGYDRLTARAELSVAADRLIDVIHALEASITPNLMIEGLEVRAPDQIAQPQKPDENVSLTVRLDVSSYWEAR